MGLEVFLARSTGSVVTSPSPAPSHHTSSKTCPRNETSCVSTGWCLTCICHTDEGRALSQLLSSPSLLRGRGLESTIASSFFKTQEEANVNGFQTISGVTSLWDQEHGANNQSSESNCEQGLNVTPSK